MRPVVVMILVGACGSGSKGATADASVSDGGDVDAAIVDAPPMLSPEPADPVGLPCTGALGFPNAAGPFVRPFRVHVARIDGDNLVDLVTSTGSGVEVAHGNGDGTFATTTLASPAPGVVGEMAVADVDGDGPVDLVYPTDSAPGITILHGSGTGTFGQAQNVVLPNYVDRVEVADLDGDGRADLIGVHKFAGEAFIVLATATGFAPPVVHAASSQNLTQLRVGDLTGDGRPEIVASNSTANTVSISINRGDGTFQPAIALGSGLQRLDALELGDFLEDGKVDIVFGGVIGSAAKVVMLRNDAQNAFLSRLEVLSGTGSESPADLRVADLDGDGHLDVLALSQVSTSAVLRGNGAGQLGAPISVDTINTAARSQLADVNGDGRVDLVLADPPASVFLNTGTASLFETRRMVAIDTALGMAGGRLVDIDADGRLDAVGFGGVDTGVSVLVTRRALAAGGYAVQSTMPAPAFSRWAISTDLDNDMRPDLLVVGSDTRVFRNLGTGVPMPAGVIAGSWTPINGAVADLDGDARRDVLVSKQTSLDTYDLGLARGMGAGQLGTPTVIGTFGRLVGATLLDLDGDKQLDLVVEDQSPSLQSHRIVRRGLGTGMFAPPVSTDIATAASLRARDVNGDGKTDLIGFALGDVYVSLSMGDGTFAPTVVSPSGSFIDIAFADFDGDGHLDLVGTTYTTDLVEIGLGRGDGTFAPTLAFPSGPTWSVQVVDTDGDGRLDLVLGDPTGLTILPGRCR